MLNLKLLDECTLCERNETRQRVIKPQGNGNFNYFFVFANPSFEEELMDEPIAGLRKDYLKIFLRELNILDNSYITNLNKCGIEKAKSKERKSCYAWFEQEVDAYKPKAVFSFERNLRKLYEKTIELPALTCIMMSEKKAKVAKRIIGENL